MAVFKMVYRNCCLQFFITRDLQALETSAWTEQYRFREDSVPYFLALDVAKKLFMGGKSYALIHDFFGHKEVPGMQKYKPDDDVSIWDEEWNRIKPECLRNLTEACLVSAKTVVDILVSEHNLGNHFSVSCSYRSVFEMFRFCWTSSAESRKKRFRRYVVLSEFEILRK